MVLDLKIAGIGSTSIFFFGILGLKLTKEKIPNDGKL